jgi:multiple sugar transport system substrate-binding protein
MAEFTRRESLALGLAAASIPIFGAGSAQAAVDDVPTRSVKQLEYELEKGATLSVLRPAKIVDADEK